MVFGNTLLADPKLSPLQNNGGLTQTHALLAGSPAIDAGKPNGCLDSSGALLQIDQRGLPRTTDGNGDGRAACDIGAVELNVQNGAPDVRLGNISTRSRVLTGDNVMVGGFIIDGLTPLRVLVRSRGPSLGAAPFFVPQSLTNPLLRLFSGQNLIAQNDNWQDAPSCSGGFFCEGAGQITSTGLDPCQPNSGQPGPPPNCNLESAILITLPPGAYTAIVTGANGETGVGLLEVFEADDSKTAANRYHADSFLRPLLSYEPLPWTHCFPRPLGATRSAVLGQPLQPIFRASSIYGAASGQCGLARSSRSCASVTPQRISTLAAQGRSDSTEFFNTPYSRLSREIYPKNRRRSALALSVLISSRILQQLQQLLSLRSRIIGMRTNFILRPSNQPD